jgi:hypothetical protein
MGAADRIVRGILLGGALGAFGAIFGYLDTLFMAVGMGAAVGCLAGLTHAGLDKRRRKQGRDFPDSPAR